MFDFWDYFVSKRDTGIYVAKYSVSPKMFSDLEIKLALYRTLQEIYKRAENDVLLFRNGVFNVFKEFDKNRSLYCRRKVVRLYPRLFRIKRDNYVRIYYSPYEEFANKIYTDKKEYKDIIKDFVDSMNLLHMSIEQSITLTNISSGGGDNE
ncbi:MAG: hypothetical protein NZM44_06000 [Candidatus Calescibacterium sp.]|nr:hypothetical protein [Candidatus Calescibacterium sp.]